MNVIDKFTIDRIIKNIVSGWQGSRAAGWHNDGRLLDIPMVEDDLKIIPEVDFNYICLLFSKGGIIFKCYYDCGSNTSVATGYEYDILDETMSTEQVIEYVRIFKEEEKENE